MILPNGYDKNQFELFISCYSDIELKHLTIYIDQGGIIPDNQLYLFNQQNILILSEQITYLDISDSVLCQTMKLTHLNKIK